MESIQLKHRENLEKTHELQHSRTETCTIKKLIWLSQNTNSSSKLNVKKNDSKFRQKLIIHTCGQEPNMNSSTISISNRDVISEAKYASVLL